MDHLCGTALAPPLSMTKISENPRPTVDPDQIIPPDRPHHPQETVGSEGGASLVGTPRRVETDAEHVPSYPPRRGEESSPTPSSPSKDELTDQE